jgi:hypothetical protein
MHPARPAPANETSPEINYLLMAGEAAEAGVVVFAAVFLLTCFFDFLAVVAVAVFFAAGAAGVEGVACAKEMPASASVIVRAAMVFMMF